LARLPVFCAAASLWLSSLRPHLLFGPRANVPKILVTKQQRSPRNSYFERGFVAALCGRGFVAGFLACASPSAEAASNAREAPQRLHVADGPLHLRTARQFHQHAVLRRCEPSLPRQPLTDLRKAEGEVDQILDDVAECVVAAALEKCSS
jgi:hypothetical protein